MIQIIFQTGALYRLTGIPLVELNNEYLAADCVFAKDKHPLDSVTQLMIQQDADVSLDWLARESCLSIKQFERIFRDRTGVKLYHCS